MAVGESPLKYRWQFNGSQIAVATNASLVLPRVRTNDIGAYTVVVRNLAGSAMSQPADLRVLIQPAIHAQPQDQTVSPGQTAIFEVAATGFEPLTYRWFFNQTAVPGAHGPELLLKNVTVNDAGSYSVALKHQTPFGPAGLISQPATLTVTP